MAQNPAQESAQTSHQTSGRIDVHCHSMSPAYRAAIKAISPIIRTPEWTPEKALAFFDRHRMAAGILSLSTPGTHLGDDAAARDLARRVNEEAASYIAAAPSRFGAFATLPIPDIEGACREAEFALDVLKLDGVGLLASYEGVYLGDPRFEPLMQVLDARRAVVLIHPNNHPTTEQVKRGISPGIGNFLVEFLFDTTRAALNLVFFDVLERYPNIRFILCHAGGTLPYVAWRLADIMTRQMNEPPWDTQYPSPFMTRHGKGLTREMVFSELKRFWYETALSAGRQSLATLKEVAAPERILFGSDWPYCPDTMTGDMLEDRLGSGMFTAEQQQAIDRGNALQLFPRFAA